MTRDKLLITARKAVGARHKHYGWPAQNFQAIALRFRAHVLSRYGIDIPFDTADVAIMSVDVKLARLAHDPSHADSWRDVAGYAACGAEVTGDGAGKKPR